MSQIILNVTAYWTGMFLNDPNQPIPGASSMLQVFLTLWSANTRLYLSPHAHDSIRGQDVGSEPECLCTKAQQGKLHHQYLKRHIVRLKFERLPAFSAAL